MTRNVSTVALVAFWIACGGNPDAYRADPEVVAEVSALLASDDETVIAFAQDVSLSFSGERVARYLLGAPDETAALTVRACHLLASRAGSARDGAKNMDGYNAGKLIGFVRRHVRKHEGEVVRARLRAAFTTSLRGSLEPQASILDSKRELAPSIAEGLLTVVENSYWKALDPKGLRGRVRNNPELDALQQRWRAFKMDLREGVVHANH